jgi:tRNA pseudouridine38-40 synthase
MKEPTVAKRPHEDGDAPDPKRVKASEDTPMEDDGPPTQTAPEELAADATTAGEKSKGKRRDAAGFPKNRKGKEKGTKNPGRRRRTRNEEALEEGAANADADADASGEPKAPRLPKRMCALLIGFCGSGYSGMQM